MLNTYLSVWVYSKIIMFTACVLLQAPNNNHTEDCICMIDYKILSGV